MKRLVFLLPLAIFAVIAIYFGVGLTRDPSALSNVMTGRELSDFNLAPIEGYKEGFSKDDLVGQVSLINIFGSWCISCRIEHPLLMEISRRGLVPIYGVDWKDEPGDGAAWLARHGDPYTKIGDDEVGRFAIDLGVSGAPETYVIDKKGVIRYHWVGPIAPQIWDEDIAPLLETLRAE